MSEIERSGIIDSERLSGEFYFRSLLDEAQKNGLVSNNDIEKLQYDCFNLLGEKIDRFTNSESSSVPVETAECISKSLLYTIGIALKSYPTPDDAVNALLNTEVGQLYFKGRRIIDKKIQAAKRLYLSMLKSMIATHNYTYKATLQGGIKGFFKLYRPDYSAQEIHITADYPPFCPINDLAGIEFIHKYIKALYYENLFCRMFSDDDIENLLLGYSHDYKEQVFNIFGLVLTNALGRVLLGKNPLGLDIRKEEADDLEECFSRLTKEQLEEKVCAAYSELCEKLEVESEPLHEYIEKALPEITSVISIACEKRVLNSVFIEFGYPEDGNGIIFDFGQKMNNSAYKAMLDEINECRFMSDKIAIVESGVKSLADLEDILLDASFSDAESYEVFALLGVYEVAALAKKYDALTDQNALELTEDELKLKRRLFTYIQMQSTDKKAEINRLYKLFK
jgi:hypothetical protein